ncbi:helix-turn-helix transcriptional regulator [Luteimonas yindakuii]|nr:helix-turn-helix transcriptional regulator [Luteimonas yindakuii]
MPAACIRLRARSVVRDRANVLAPRRAVGGCVHLRSTAVRQRSRRTFSQAVLPALPGPRPRAEPADSCRMIREDARVRVQHHLLHGSQSLAPATLDSECLNLVRGRGRGNRMQVPAGWISLCVVLSGCLELRSQDTDWPLSRGRYQLWLEGSLRCASHGHGWWLMLTGPATAWHPGTRAPVTDMLPWEAACPRAVMRPLVRLARSGRRAEAQDPATVAGIVADLRHAIFEHQQDLHTHLQRCSGRTRLRRQQTLLRLLRVQHLIRCHLEDHMALGRLAASASYSPCHLVRLYRNVFGETPNEYAARLRCQRARELVCGTSMPVCEIAETLGFESESAFCRAFKQAFGCTATSARRDGLPAPGSATDRMTASPSSVMLEGGGSMAIAQGWLPRGELLPEA